jgi:hypothetical protein
MEPFQLTSDNTDAIDAALSAFQAEMVSIPKNRHAEIEMKNGRSYEYDYADLSDAIDAAKSVLKTHGLNVTQPPDFELIGETIWHVVWTRVGHSSGQWILGRMLIGPSVLKAQELGSGMTYVRRYAYLASLGLVSDFDDDGALANAAYGEGSKKATRGTRAPRGSTSTNGRSRGTAAAGEGMTAANWNKVLKHFAHLSPPVTDTTEVLGRVNKILGTNADGRAKIAAEDGEKLFTELGIK